MLNIKGVRGHGVGASFASRHGQKGTVGITYRQVIRFFVDNLLVRIHVIVEIVVGDPNLDLKGDLNLNPKPATLIFKPSASLTARSSQALLISGVAQTSRLGCLYGAKPTTPSTLTPDP